MRERSLAGGLSLIPARAPARRPDTLHAIPARASHQVESRFLSELISTVGSSLELEQVLEAVVRLLSDASAVHACFVYLLDRGAPRLVLRAASEPYAGLVGRIELAEGEGLAWWSVEHREPAFIREHALDDPRVKYVPELEEERFQSLVSVPILGRDGDAIGVISLHTEAPREFDEAEADFLVSSASLVAGAIENARLYDEARRRVRELEQLTELGETIARAETLDELVPAVADRGLELLGATACHVSLLDRASEELRLRASAPPGAHAPTSIRLGELGPELASSARSARVAVPLVAGDELLGLLTAEGTSEIDLARAVANQAAVAIKKIDLIERLTEKNRIKDFFEQLAAGRGLAEAGGHAARLGADLSQPHLVVMAAPASDALEHALARTTPVSLFDRRDESMRALLRIPPGAAAALVDRVRRVQAALPGPTAIGISNPCAGAASFVAGFEEARHALLGTTVLQREPAVLTYDELGAYKYLLRMSLDPSARDAHRDAIARLVEYDEARSSQLLRTLEEFLRRRGTIGATAQALYIHPNTLRQRLRRIGELTGLDLRREDWLMVEIAVKLVSLQRALETDSNIAGARSM